MTMIGWHNALARALAVACAHAKVPAIRPGNFRHTLLTTGIEQGAAPGALSAFVNHRSVRTTMRYYATLAVRPNPMLKAATPAPVPPSPPTTAPSSNEVGKRRRLAVVK
jgi:integrase